MQFRNTSTPLPDSLPDLLLTPAFTARPLTDAYVALDYEAYMASPNVIAQHSAGRWQVEGFTLDENRRQLAQHAADHAARRSFAFILLAPDEQRSFGCLYINPLRDFLRRATPDAIPAIPEEAMLSFWIREELHTTDLPDLVVRDVQAWLLRDWNFDGHLWRIREEETRSQQALERAGLRGRCGVTVPGVGRYSFFG